jgi:hypothetical protein
VPPLIPEFSRAIGQSAPRDYRDAVNDQAQLGFRGIEFREDTSELGTILNHHSTSCRAGISLSNQVFVPYALQQF